MKNKCRRFITFMMVLVFVFGSMVAAPLNVQADSPDSVTVNFPGVDGVNVEYHSNTPGLAGWRTVGTNVDDYHTFVLTGDRVASHIRVSRNGMTYTFEPEEVVLTPGVPLVLDVPMREIVVSGINAPSFAPANVSIVQGGWVYQNVPVLGNNAGNPFIVFDNGRAYEVRISTAGYHHLAGRFTGTTGDENIWFGNLFSQHLVPAGVANIRISNANWVDTTITPSSMMGGDVITLFNNSTQAMLHFAYGGRTFGAIPFMLDGANPFGNMTVIRFDGMTNVTLEKNSGSGWQAVPGTFDDYAILFDLPAGTQIRGVLLSPARFVSSIVITDGGFGQVVIPTGEVTVTGIAIPGLDVRVQHANNGTHANGPLLHHAQNNQDSGFSFHTWDIAGENQMFAVQLNGLGFQGPRFWFTGFNIDLSNYFYEVFIPSGVTGVTVRNANGGIVNGINNRDAGSFWLINTGNVGTLTFTFEDVQHTVDIVFDGTNPFGNITIVRFDGMTGVTLQTNIGLFNEWNTVSGIHSNYAVLFGLAPDTRIRGYITSPARIVSLEVHSIGAFVGIDLPVSEVAVYGIAMPDLNVDIRRSNDEYLTSGALLHRLNPSNPHTGGDIYFNTFTTALGEAQLFMVSFGGNLGFSALQRFFDNYTIDLNEYFYEIEIPYGLSNVVIRNAANAALHGRTDFAAGDTIMLIETGQPVDLIFTFEGVQYRVPAYLDGTNPFDQVVILRFPGAAGITEIRTQMTGHGWTNRTDLDVGNHFAFRNTKWMTPQGTDLLFVQLFAPGLSFSMHHPTGGVPVFTVIDIPVTTITVINDLGWNVHVSTQQTGAPGQNAPGRNGIWFENYESGASELVFWVFDYGSHWVRAGAPVNGFDFATLDGIEPGARVYLSQIFGVSGCDCDFCPDCGECQDCGECPAFGLDIFNNGPTGAPSRANPNLAAAGTIRMWTQFDGVGADIPFSVADNMQAVDQDGNCVRAFVTIGRIWAQGEGWLDYFRVIDVNKNAPWQHIYLTLTVCDQAHVVRLCNARFFSFNIFNNGPDGCASRANESLANAEIIRMWTQLGGVNTPIPIAFANTITATVRANGECAMDYVNARSMWEDGVGWIPYFNQINVNKNAPWEFIDLTITVFGQTIEVVLHNANAPPQPGQPCDMCDEYPCVCLQPGQPCDECDEYPCVCLQPGQPCDECDEYPCVCSPPGQPCDVCDEYPCDCELEMYVYSATLLEDGSVELVVNITGACHLENHELRIMQIGVGVSFEPNPSETQTITITINPSVTNVNISLMCPDSGVRITVDWNISMLDS